MLLGLISLCCPLSCTPQKRSFFSFQFGPEENITGHSFKMRAYWFVLKITRVFPIPTGRLGIGSWTLICYLILPPHVRYSFEDKSKLVLSKKAFLLPSVWPGIEYTWALIWKKSLMICFENYQGLPYSHTGRIDRVWWTLC